MKPKPPTTGRVMWQSRIKDKDSTRTELHQDSTEAQMAVEDWDRFDQSPKLTDIKPVLILPLTPEAIRAIVTRRAKAIARTIEGVAWRKIAEPYQKRYLIEARTTLIADGVPVKLIDQALKDSK